MGGTSEQDALRIGTMERDEAAQVLADHFADGRLTDDEYQNRLSTSLSAVTRADVRAVFADLPEPHPSYLRQQSPATVPVGTNDLVTTSSKSKVAAGVLQIVLPFGVGRFYTGHTSLAIIQLVVVLITFGGAAIWPIVDGILLLVHGGVDSDGRRLRD